MGKQKGGGKGRQPKTPQRTHGMRIAGNDEAGAGGRSAKKAGSAQKAQARGAQENMCGSEAAAQNVTLDPAAPGGQSDDDDDGWNSNVEDFEPKANPYHAALAATGAVRADAVWWKWRNAVETKQATFKCPKRDGKAMRTWLIEVILNCESPQIRWILNAIKIGDIGHDRGAPVLGDFQLLRCRKEKICEHTGKDFSDLYGKVPQSEWLSSHLHLWRVERVCVRVHAAREAELRTNPHAVFPVSVEAKESPAWTAWDLFDQILGQRTMLPLSQTERKMYSVECAVEDDSAAGAMCTATPDK